jgi:hypothetical protein
VNGWINGPFTPAGQGSEEYVAQWITGRLADPDAGYSSIARSTLSDIKSALETRLRRYFIADT